MLHVINELLAKRYTANTTVKCILLSTVAVQHCLHLCIMKSIGTVVAITHDRYFLENSCSWILELDRGEAYPFEGNYSGWLEKKAARAAAEAKVI
jgi:hypothetical protein